MVNGGTFRNVEVYILFAGIEEFKTATVSLNVFHYFISFVIIFFFLKFFAQYFTGHVSICRGTMMSHNWICIYAEYSHIPLIFNKSLTRPSYFSSF